MEDAESTYEAAIIGGGSAGLSAALLLGRCGRRTIVLDDGRPRNAVAEHMHGFLTRDGTPPNELLQIAREQLGAYNCVERVSAHVEAIANESGVFCLRTAENGTYGATRVLLATGAYDALPDIPGVREAWGRSVFVCPYCDGWEMRHKRIAVVGKGGKAVQLAQELRQWSRDIIVCTQGEDSLSDPQQRWLERARVTHHTTAIRRIISADGCVQHLEFEDDRREPCEAIFINAPLRLRHPLVDMLGCEIRTDGEIAIDERGRTTIPRVYAAGDAVTSVHQVALAVASGVCAAMALNEDALSEETAALLNE